MYLGRIVESGSRERIWHRPLHPYTQALLAAAPLADPKRARARPRRILPGELPNPIAPPPGCAFHPRCPIAQERCRHEAPALRPFSEDAAAACHFAEA